MFVNPALYTRAQAFDPLSGLGDEVSETLNFKRFVYDFSVLGGAIGTVQLKDEQGNPALLPVGSVILSVIVDMITAVTSAGSATVALGCTSSSDLLGATAKASLASGLVAGVPVMTAATAVKVATGSSLLQRPNFSVAAQPVSAIIAVAALTAGKFYVHCAIARSAIA